MATANNAINVQTPAPFSGAVIGANTIDYGFNYLSIPGKNRIVNGDFSMMQYGGRRVISSPSPIQQKEVLTTDTGEATYCFDRWQLIPGTQDFDAYQYGPNEDTYAIDGYFARIKRKEAQNPPAVTTVMFGTTLIPDMCTDLVNKNVTLSFLMRRGAGFSSLNNMMRVELRGSENTTLESGLTHGWPVIQAFNIDLTTQITGFFNNSISLNTSAQPYRQYAIVFQYTTNDQTPLNDYFDIKNVQLEDSPKQTPFEYVDKAIQRLRCQRFYAKSFPYNQLPKASPDPDTGYIIGATMPTVFSISDNEYVSAQASLIFQFPATLLTVPVYQPGNTGSLKIYNPFTDLFGNGEKIAFIDGVGSRAALAPTERMLTTTFAWFRTAQQNTGGTSAPINMVPVAHYSVFVDVV